MKETQQFTMGELFTLEYGKPVPDKESSDGSVPVYGTNGQIGTSHLKPLCNHPSVILGRKGAYRGVHYSNRPFSVIDTAFYIELITDKVDIKWLYYKLLTYDINSMDSGSAIPSTDRYQIYSLPIEVPSISTQRRIVDILDSITTKIELNRQINDNLEQQIQALYQAWFIDLVPFNGVRPNSWDYGLLSDLLTIQKETIKPHNVNGMPYLPIDAIPMRCLGINRFAPSEDALSSLQKFHSNDIVIGAMRVYFHRVIIAPCEGITRNTSFVLRPNMLNTLAYCLCLCNQKDTIDFAQATSKGTTMPYAVWEGGLANMPITIPDKNILNEFETLVMPLISSIRDSYLERIKLEQLRDSLLPKLMSGELKINKIDC